jgi:hypothetical protein
MDDLDYVERSAREDIPKSQEELKRLADDCDGTLRSWYWRVPTEKVVRSLRRQVTKAYRIASSPERAVEVVIERCGNTLQCRPTVIPSTHLDVLHKYARQCWEHLELRERAGYENAVMWAGDTSGPGHGSWIDPHSIRR